MFVGMDVCLLVVDVCVCLVMCVCLFVWLLVGLLVRLCVGVVGMLLVFFVVV